MKNKIFTLILLALLTLPISVWAVDDVQQTEPMTIVNTLDEDIVEQSQEVEENQYKQPLSKRKIAKKFLLAMSGVAISSFAIFFLLTVYNRIREGVRGQIGISEEETSLETPDDLSSAVRTFLEKTKW